MAKRRGHGEGAIYQRESDGKWCASIDLGIINGKRKRKIIYGKTRKEVADKLKALHRDHASGINVAPEQMMVKQFLDRWIEQSIKHQRRPKTAHSYAQIVRLYLIPHLGNRQLTKLMPEHVQAMLNQLLISGGAAGSGLSPRTVQYIRAVLRQALNQAIKWDYVARNVAEVVDGPRVEKFKIAPLDQQQAQRLLDAVSGHRLETLYRLTLSLGLREGEVLGLRWEDVHFEQRTLRISGALQLQDGKLKRVATKTESSTRTLPLPPVLLQALQTHRASQDEERKLLGDEWQEHGLVFPSTLGTPMSPRNLVRHFKIVLQKAELPLSTRFHDLRHSCATLLIAQGVHPRIVMEILGHSQISVTMNTYAHALPETTRAAADKLDALFTGNTKQPPEDHKS